MAHKDLVHGLTRFEVQNGKEDLRQTTLSRLGMI